MSSKPLLRKRLFDFSTLWNQPCVCILGSKTTHSLFMLRNTFTSFILGLGIFVSSAVQAQTLTADTNWLKEKLNSLVIDKDESVNPQFDFNDCQMTMKVDTKEEGITVKMDMNWPLKEIRKVSYKPSTGGAYTLLLDIPGDKVKGKMKIGIFSKKIRSKANEGHTSIDLRTTDEKLVQEIKQRFEGAIKQCQAR
ncbi:hypothetical protein Slin_5016 [Spirosoma linguale DSM 74]|uniref:Uncharacterized protein n=2 Tax=Spirosoma TaxID=107 RepID=D2QCY7_SPILD|nr:hypothetical protein Slin_5016 [Spirosoma linguale DSM 74]